MAKFKINTKAFKELFTTIKKNIKSFLKKTMVVSKVIN